MRERGGEVSGVMWQLEMRAFSREGSRTLFYADSYDYINEELPVGSCCLLCFAVFLRVERCSRGALG